MYDKGEKRGGKQKAIKFNEIEPNLKLQLLMYNKHLSYICQQEIKLDRQEYDHQAINFVILPPKKQKKILNDIYD